MRRIVLFSAIVLIMCAPRAAGAWSVEVGGGPALLKESAGAEHEGRGWNAVAGTGVRPWLTLRAEAAWYQFDGPRDVASIPEISSQYDPSTVLAFTYGVRLHTPPPKSAGLILYLDSGVGAGWGNWGALHVSNFNGPGYTVPGRSQALWYSSIAAGARTGIPRPWPNIGAALRMAFLNEHDHAGSVVQPTLSLVW
jgi:hypothetical protein